MAFYFAAKNKLAPQPPPVSSLNVRRGKNIFLITYFLVYFWVILFMRGLTMPVIFDKIEVKERRKELRNKATYAEKLLWSSLNKSQLEGRKFPRQYSIGYYIVDFYCPSEKLVVELDGDDHFTEEGIKYDKRRDEFLTSQGLKIIRFENQEVLYNISYIIKKIKECFK
jgi:very-short-patch-repair endonuclease